MSSARRPPTDRDIERLLHLRAADPDTMLLQDILAASEALPQRGRWFGTRSERRRLLAILTTAVLVALVVGGTLSVGAGLIRPPRPEPTPARVHQIEGPLEAGKTYWVDPDYNTSTPLRVNFTVPADGWLPWTGTYKDIDDEGIDDKYDGVPRERISINIVEVSNLTVDACHDQSLRTPAVGPSVDDLAEALEELPPFEVVSPAADVSAYGYRGKHLVLRIPEDMVGTDGIFEGCVGALRAWTSQILSYGYWGYVRPGDTEEYWILDVDGTRLVISVLTTAGTSQELISEKQAVLDSIVIVPQAG
jgi:hypothetical protein